MTTPTGLNTFGPPVPPGAAPVPPAEPPADALSGVTPTAAPAPPQTGLGAVPSGPSFSQPVLPAQAPFGQPAAPVQPGPVASPWAPNAPQPPVYPAGQTPGVPAPYPGPAAYPGQPIYPSQPLPGQTPQPGQPVYPPQPALAWPGGPVNTGTGLYPAPVVAPKRKNRGLAVVLVVLAVALGIGGLNGFVNWISESDAPRAVVLTYLNAVAVGDADTALAQTNTPPVDKTFLTYILLADSLEDNPLTEIKVTSVSSDGNHAEVAASYRIGGTLIADRIFLVKNGANWYMRTVVTKGKLSSTTQKNVIHAQRTRLELIY